MIRYSLVIMIIFVSMVECTKRTESKELKSFLHNYNLDEIRDYIRGYKKEKNILCFNRNDVHSKIFTRKLVNALICDISLQSKEDLVKNNIDLWVIASIMHNCEILKLAKNSYVAPYGSRDSIIHYNQKRKERAFSQLKYDDAIVRKKSKQEIARIAYFEHKYQKAIEEWNECHE